MQTHQRSSLRKLLGVLVVAVALTAAPATAESRSTGSTGAEGAWGFGAFIGSLIYGPVKVVYAVGGSLVSGMAWMFSGGDREVVMPILEASVRGDYVLTPGHLRGEQTVEFIGRSAQQRELRAQEYGYGSGEPGYGPGPTQDYGVPTDAQTPSDAQTQAGTDSSLQSEEVYSETF